MATSGTLSLKLVIDGSNVGAIRALTQVASAADKTGSGLSRLDLASGNFGKTRAGLESISTQLARVQQMASGIAGITVGVSGVGELVRLADEYTAMNSRLKLASQSSNDFKAAQQGVFEIAQRNGQSLSATGTFYGRIADSVRRMGKDSVDALSATEAVAASLKISGASTAEAASAQLQFAQALAAGALRGDELNGVLEASPRLAKALADGLRVPQGELKKLGEEGRLTSQAVLEALLSQKAALVGEAASMELTIGQSLTNVRNAFTKAFGERASGGTAALAAGINSVAANIETLINVAIVAGAALAGVFGTRLIGSIAAAVTAKQALIAQERAVAAAAVAAAQANVANATAMAAQTLATEKLATAKLQLAAAERAATVAGAGVAARSGGMLLGLLGGPIGAIATALTVGVTAWQIWGQKGEEAAGRTGKSLGDLVKEFKEFGATMTEQQKIKAYDDLAAAIRRARDEEAKIRRAARERAESDWGVVDVAVAVDNDPAVKAAGEQRIAAEQLLQERLRDIEKASLEERAQLRKALVEKQKALNGELIVDEKKALEQQVQAHAKAADAVRDAWQKSLADAKSKREEALAAPQKTADLKAGLQERVDAVKQTGMSDEERADFQAMRAQEAGQAASDARMRASFELTRAYSLKLRGDLDGAKKAFDTAEKDLNKAFSQAEKAGDTATMEESAARLADVSDTRGQMANTEAAQAEQQAEAQRATLLDLESKATELKNKLAGMEVDVKIDAAMSKIVSLQNEAAKLQGMLGGNKADAGTPAPAPASDAPGFAFGGELPGTAPHDRADNMLYWGTPGEWVIQRPAVRYYGQDFIARLNAMRLPKYAFGGQIGGSVIDRLQIPAPPSNVNPASSIDGLAPANFYLDGQRYPMRGEPDVVSRMAEHFAREALRKGGRG